jgi:hypothetical protein
MKSPAIIFIAAAVIVIWFCQLVFKTGVMVIYFVNLFIKDGFAIGNDENSIQLSKDFDKIFAIPGIVEELRSSDLFEKELNGIIAESENKLSDIPSEPVKKSRKPRMTKARMIELEYNKYCDRESCFVNKDVYS